MAAILTSLTIERRLQRSAARQGIVNSTHATVLHVSNRGRHLPNIGIHMIHLRGRRRTSRTPV